MQVLNVNETPLLVLYQKLLNAPFNYAFECVDGRARVATEVDWDCFDYNRGNDDLEADYEPTSEELEWFRDD